MSTADSKQSIPSELAGQCAIVTGASRGIGAATAWELARQGMSVMLAARNTDQINAIALSIRDAGGRAEAQQCDVSVFDEVDTLVKRTCESFGGRIDVLVNNAGLIDPIAHLAESDPDAWSRIVDVNYKGVYYGLRAVLPLMISQRNGVVINLSSGAAASALEGWSHYCSTKAAVLSLTRCAHKEYGDSGIRVCGLSPGMVATGMQQSIRESGLNVVSKSDPNSHISPEEVATAIAWLCTDDAADTAGTDFSIKTPEGRTRAGLATR